MANDYQSNINKKLLRQFVKSFESDSVLLNTVSKQLVNDFDASTGGDYGQVSMKRPTQYAPTRTADGDMTGVVQPVRTGKVQGVVSNYATVFIENTQVEEALETDQLEELIKPAVEDIVVELESELATFMATNAALVAGDPTKPIAAWTDVAYAGDLLKEIGAPSGKRYGAISSFDETVLANLQSGLGVQNEVSTAWATAQVRAGFAGLNNVLTSNNLPEYTAGSPGAGPITLSATPSATYTSYKDTYRMSLALTGLTATTGTLKAGQSLEFAASPLVNLRNGKVLRKAGAAIPFTATVLEDVTADGSGNATVSVSGAAILEAGVNSAYNTVGVALTSGDTVTVLDTAAAVVRPALAYCEGFVGMGSVVLPKLHAKDTMIVNHKGMSIRLHKFSDGVAAKNQYRFDILPTFACFNPFWGVKVHGA